MQKTIEVKDNKGTVVEVKPVDIAAGDTTAEFEFVKTVTEVKGIWTVAGMEYDADLAANLAAFVAADTQLGLNKVFADLGIKNLEVANIQKYLDGKANFLADLEGDLTVEAIQGFVDKVNVDAVDAGEKAAAEKAATDAVVKALEANNDIALLSALQNDVFARVNDEWINEYKAGFFTGDANALVKPAYAAAVQTVINTVNKVKVNAVDVLGKEVDRAKLLEAKALIETYATPDAKGEQKTETKTALKNIDIQLAIVDVREATTPTNLKAKVTALAEVVNDTEQLNIKDYKDANGKAYIAKMAEANAKAGVKSVADVKKAIDDANTAADAAEAALKITEFAVAQTDTNGLGKTTFNTEKFANDRIVTVTGDYLALTEYPANNNTPPSTAKWIGVKITLNEQFKNGFDLLLDGEDLREDLKLDGDHYLLYYFVPKAGGNTKTLDFTVKDAEGKVVQKDEFTIKFVDKLSDEGALVMMNEAKDAEAMRVATSEMAALKSTDAYINLSSAAKLEVAEIVLAAREKAEDKEFASVDVATKAITDNVTTYTEFLTGVNTADSINGMNTALDKVAFPEFQKLSASEKIAKAEVVLNALNELKALETPSSFKTIAEVKAAAGL